PAMAISSVCAPAQPAPARMVIFSESFRTFASCVISSSEGQTLGCGGGNFKRGCSTTASHKAMSPGIATTETPCRAIAVCMAISKTRGICSGMGNQLAVVAALREKIFRMRLLKIAAANFLTWNLRGDGKNWNTAAVTIVKSIDQMQIAWTATSRADREAAGQMRFRTGGEGGRFFMPHLNPLHSFLF